MNFILVHYLSELLKIETHNRPKKEFLKQSKNIGNLIGNHRWSTTKIIVSFLDLLINNTPKLLMKKKINGKNINEISICKYILM